MTDFAVKVENLGKKYSLTHQTRPHNGFRHVLQDALLSPLKIFQGKARATQDNTEAGPTTEEFWALKDVSFEVKPGEVLGIIGRNGAGKSTLLKILSRITEPTLGQVRINGRVASLLEVGTGFHGELTGRENIYLNGTILGMTRREIKRKFDEIIAFAETEKFLDMPVKHYSSGMYVRLAFAVAAHLEPEILIVDEVLAVGDAQFQKKCLGKMQDVSSRSGRTVIFVSHNMIAMQNLCTSAIVMDKGRIIKHSKTDDAISHYYDSVKAQREIQLAARSDRKGAQNLKFHNVTFHRSGQKSPVEAFRLGENAIVRLHYKCDRTWEKARVLAAFNLKDHSGLVLANINSVDSGCEQMEIGREGYFECIWKKIAIRSGTYLCAIFCSINDQIQDLVEEAMEIRIEDGDFYGTGHLIERNQGAYLVENSWSSHPMKANEFKE